MAPLPLSRATMFYDGARDGFPRLSNPEGVAVHRDGSVWCGTGLGDIVRIDPDGAGAQVMGRTGGFSLGLDFDGDDNLYLCDMTHCCVFRLDARTLELARFGPPMRIPNVPLVDRARGLLYVSDSFAYDRAGPGVWRFDLRTGLGGLWCDADFGFANGLALSAETDWLYVAESASRCVRRVPIAPDGSAGTPEPWIAEVPGIPDGLAWDHHGRLVVTCYEPSRICVETSPGQLEILIEDPSAIAICHPANVALRGKTMFTANLGRWHIGSIELDS